MRFDSTEDLSYYTPSRSEYLASKFSTPTYEYSEWRTFSSGTTEDGFSDDASESTDMEPHSLESANFMPALSPPPTMPRKPATISIPRSSVLSDRRAKCRMSFGLSSDEEDNEQEDDGSTLSDVAMWDGDRLQLIFDEQQEEIAYCRDRISRMTKNTQDQSKRAQDLMQTIHQRDDEIGKMQMAMNRFRHLLQLKDKEIQDLLNVIQESC
ncbi:hypothetical protein K450DRAFT_218489 [Umbelopsis ramanniana AG]|uniref:Uncharacterized protein n=1 Tax=Umbelopsis ramanniana AG TaxID=1314678 RepID=A0AAD5EHV7_UMBRA|nr:uncharacterized protein K450DRAFT_218489 [Umbelopsis ramanniana AG]KAI8584166.1 hypothetical protein K450DRAFT_218489 [Umbelopsis ramanniana AG]